MAVVLAKQRLRYRQTWCKNMRWVRAGIHKQWPGVVVGSITRVNTGGDSCLDVDLAATPFVPFQNGF